jgi:prevent-host-death family protein
MREMDTVESVTVRELRNKWGEILARVERGERVIVTRDGRAIAELHPVAPLQGSTLSYESR